MGDKVHYRVEERVALLTIDNPPVNALSHPVRAALAGMIDRAAGDEGVDAVVIAAAGRTFPAGADLSEFGKPPGEPTLPGLLALIEGSASPSSRRSTAPRSAAGSNWRSPATTGWPPRTRGSVCPRSPWASCRAAGGTQRLPRLAGERFALDLMLKGRPVSADEAAEAGLVDGVVEGDLESAAISFAQTLKEEDLGPRPTSEVTAGFADPGAYLAAVTAEREAHGGTALEAPRRIVDCVEAALLMPFETGMAYERAAFEDLVGSPSPPRSATSSSPNGAPPGSPDWRARAAEIRTLGIVGGGTMGIGDRGGAPERRFRRDPPRTRRGRARDGVARIVDMMDGSRETRPDGARDAGPTPRPAQGRARLRAVRLRPRDRGRLRGPRGETGGLRRPRLACSNRARSSPRTPPISTWISSRPGRTARPTSSGSTSSPRPA
jgi:3-hydroxyacyl-CoA dehydrogenase